MSFKNNLGDYFNLKNLKIDNKNIIYNKKMVFYIIKHFGWLLNKKSTRNLLVKNMIFFLKELSLKNNILGANLLLHSYKIKNSFTNINESYINFLDFTINFLKYIDKELYKKLKENGYIEKIKQQTKNIYQNMQNKDYFISISYGNNSDSYDIVKDYYYSNYLKKNDSLVFNELLTKFSQSLGGIFDGLEKIFDIENYYEINNLEYLYNFFGEEFSFLNDYGDIIKTLDQFSLDKIDLVTLFNSHIEKYEKSNKKNKIKYLNKIIFNIYEIYEKTKRKIISDKSDFSNLTPIQIKEWEVYKINNFFYKTFYVTPINKIGSNNTGNFPIKMIEQELDKMDLNFSYMINQSISPLSITGGEYETLGVDENSKKELMDIGLFNTTYIFTLKSLDYNVILNIEEKMKKIEMGYNLKFIEDKDIANLFPSYRKKEYSFITSSINLFSSEFIENGYEDVFLDFYPKNISYNKGAIFSYDIETRKPVFWNPADEKICLNKHMTILGKSGSGKTYGTRVLIKNALFFNKFILVDHLGNYNKMVEELGGKIIKLDNKLKINPLIYNKNLGTSIEVYIEYIISLLSGQKDNKKLSIEEERLLKQVLGACYKNPYRSIKNGRTFLNIDELIMKTKEFLNGFKDSKETTNVNVANNLIQFLKSKKTEEIGLFLQTDNELKISDALDSHLTLFDFKSLKENSSPDVIDLFSFLIFQSIYKYLYSSFDNRKKIISKMDNTGLDKRFFKENINQQEALPIYLIIDEIHNYLRNETIADRIKLIVKEARNKSAGLISISQEINDFLNNEYGNSIFNQSASYIIFNYDIPIQDAKLIKERLLSKDDPLGIDDSDIDFLTGNKDILGGALYLHGALPAQKIRTLSLE